jgi:hypothetical protein
MVRCHAIAAAAGSALPQTSTPPVAEAVNPLPIVRGLPFSYRGLNKPF